MLDIDPFPFLAALATDDTLFVVVYSALLPVIGMDLTEMGVIRPVLAASKNGTEHGRATVIRPANGDHTHGNGLCTHAEVIASQASAREMEAFGPERLQQMMEAAPGLGETGEYFIDIFGPFDFSDVAEKLPTKTFSALAGASSNKTGLTKAS